MERKKLCIGILILMVACGISAADAKPLIVNPTAVDKMGVGAVPVDVKPVPLPTKVYGTVYGPALIAVAEPIDHALRVESAEAIPRYAPSPNANVTVYCFNWDVPTEEIELYMEEGASIRPIAVEHTTTDENGEYSVEFRYKVCPDDSIVVTIAEKNNSAGWNMSVVKKHHAEVDVYMKLIAVPVPTKVYGTVYGPALIAVAEPIDHALRVESAEAIPRYAPSPNANVTLYCFNWDVPTEEIEMYIEDGASIRPIAVEHTTTDENGEYSVEFRYKVCPDDSIVVTIAEKNNLVGWNRSVVERHRAEVDVHMKYISTPTTVHGLVLISDVDCDQAMDCIVPIPDADVDVICKGYITMTETNNEGEYSVEFASRLCPDGSEVIVRARKEDEVLYGEADGVVRSHEARINVEVYPRPIPISAIQVEGYTYTPVLQPYEKVADTTQPVFELIANASVTVTCYSDDGTITQQETNSDEIGFYNVGFLIFDCPSGSEIHAEAEKGAYYGEVEINTLGSIMRLDILMNLNPVPWPTTVYGTAYKVENCNPWNTIECISPVPNASVGVDCYNPDRAFIAHQGTTTDENGDYNVQFEYEVCPDGSMVIVKAWKNDYAGSNRGTVERHKAEVDVLMHTDIVTFMVYGWNPILPTSEVEMLDMA